MDFYSKTSKSLPKSRPTTRNFLAHPDHPAYAEPMRGRTIALIIAAWLLLTAAIIFLYSRDTEPSYHGRSLSQWIKASSRASEERDAYEAIVHITTNSFPALLRWALADTNPRFALINKLPFSASQNPFLRRFLYRDNEIFRAACAIRAFEIAGTNAACAVPALAAMISDDNPHVAVQSLYVLSLIGPAAVPAVHRAMSCETPYIRAIAIGSLKRFGTNAAEAIPDVLKALSDENINVRQSATDALVTLYPAALTNTPVQ